MSLQLVLGQDHVTATQDAQQTGPNVQLTLLQPSCPAVPPLLHQQR